MGKRNPNGEGSVRQRADGRFEGRVTTPSGTISVYGKTEKAARVAMREAIAKAEAGLDVKRGNVTLAVFLDEWMTQVVERRNKPKTIASYRQVLRLYILPHLGSVRLSKLTAHQVQRMLSAMLDGGLAPRTVNYTRSILRAALNQAIKWGYLSSNAAANATPARQKARTVEPPSHADVQRLIAHARATESDLWPLIVTAATTGLRQGELLGLRWDDVDLDQQTLRVLVTAQRVGTEWILADPKSATSRRTLSMPAQTVAAIRAQKAKQNEAKLLAGPAWKGLGTIFTSAKGTPFDESNLNKRLHQLQDAAGVKRFGMHALRHYCASLLAADGISLHAVKEQLGHSQIALTFNTYAHVTPATLQLNASVIEKMMASGE